MPASPYAVIYTLALFGVALYGLQSLVLTILFLRHRSDGSVQPPHPSEWPAVTIQLPVFNEQFVVERLIDSACNLDYPPGKLSIQVLDDSTDQTTQIAQERVDFYCKSGIDIKLIHRGDRTGFKAGALAQGLESATGEFTALLDADFVPSPDFLEKLIPYLAADPNLGMVQARWGHLNLDYSPVTRGQAMFLDGHFIVEQTARSRAGLLFNFNGSGGIWRKACIEDSGGWQHDTLAEDLDLSYRAQIRGWKMGYIPDVIAPAELPPQLAAFKDQQYRWTLGALQVLKKLGGEIWRAPFSLTQKAGGFMHISAYIAYVFMLIFVLTCLPVVLTRGEGLPWLDWLSLVTLGPVGLFAVSQWATYPDWKRRMIYLPVLIAFGIGVGLNNMRAVLVTLFTSKTGEFTRTPKFSIRARSGRWQDNPYRLPVHWTVWGELALSIYAAVTAFLAIDRLPGLVPVSLLFMGSFGYVGVVQLRQAWDSRSSLSPSHLSLHCDNFQ